MPFTAKKMIGFAILSIAAAHSTKILCVIDKIAQDFRATRHLGNLLLNEVPLEIIKAHVELYPGCITHPMTLPHFIHTEGESSAIHIATALGRVDLIPLLVQHGADPNLTPGQAHTIRTIISECYTWLYYCQPLDIAIENEDIRTMQVLLENGATITQSTLTHAVEREKVAALSLLLACHDKLGKHHHPQSTINYLISIAIHRNYRSIIDLLKAHASSEWFEMAIKQRSRANDTDPSDPPNYMTIFNIWRGHAHVIRWLKELPSDLMLLD